jgi:hypothetical protein
MCCKSVIKEQSKSDLKEALKEISLEIGMITKKKSGTAALKTIKCMSDK